MSLPSIKNRVGCATATTGTGTITLGSAESGYQSFSSAYGANANVDILIEDGTAWEIARDCTYDNSAGTVTRGTLEASSTGSVLTLSGTAKVYVTNTAARIDGVNLQSIRPSLFVTGDGASAQSLSAVTWTKISTALNATPIIDNYSCWDSANKKYTPNKAGKWLFFGEIKGLSLSSGKFSIAAIRKNGSSINESTRVYNSSGGASDQESGLSVAMVDMNGTTDYIELYGYLSEAKNVGAGVSTMLIALYCGL